jgi:signal transduction histidine kinase
MGRFVRLPRWRPPADEHVRRERTLASVRALTALLLAAATLVVPVSTAPAFPRVAFVAYGAFAVAMFVATRVKKGPVTRIAFAAHTIDVVLGGALLGSGTPVAGFVIMVVALVGAAHRWGARATVGTAVAAIIVSAAGPAATILRGAPIGIRHADPFSTLALPGALLLIAVAIGWVTHASEQLRGETETVVALLNHAEVRLGLKHSLAIIFDGILRRFDARRAMFVVHEFASDRIFLWQGGTFTGSSAEPLRVVELDPQHFDSYLFPPSSAAWSAIRLNDPGDRLDVVALDADGTLTDEGPRAFPQPFLSAVGPFRQLMGIGVDRPGSWTGRLFLVDPSEGDRVAALAFAQRIVRHICPALDNVYLLHRLRSKSAANERARIARELHDGIIQSVMGVQMQLHTLGPAAAARSRSLADELNRLAALLHEEVLNLRDLMQQMKPLELPPDRFVDTLADTVQRFQYESGIAARFITQHDVVDLPPRVCRELLRVVQEALVNVRKHSGARHVFVRLTLGSGLCSLWIEDDGCGFPFTGRLSLPELATRRQVPRVIAERVRLLGGTLTVESAPTEGARLEISIPLATSYAIAG